MNLRRNNLAHWLWGGAILAMLLLIGGLLWPKATAVEVGVVDRGPVVHDVVAEGRTRVRDLYLLSAPTTGRLARVLLKPGDLIKKGEVVATVFAGDPSLRDEQAQAGLNAAAVAARAAVASATAARDEAQQDYDRAAKLVDVGYTARAAFDHAKAALSRSEADLAQRRGQLVASEAAAAIRWARSSAASIVRSPASGKVLRVLQESEAVVVAGAPIVEVGDTEVLEIEAEFRSEDAALIRPGMPAQAEGWGGAPAAAEITRVEPAGHTKVSALGVEEQRVFVIARLTDGRLPIGHGFRVDLRVRVFSADEATRLPAEALVRRGSDWSAFRLEGGKARLRAVSVGEGGEAFRTVVSGLHEGDRIVLYPGDAIKDGETVEPKRH